MKSRSASGYLLILLFCLLGAGCVTPGGDAQRPSWWEHARGHDIDHLYFRARGDSSVSLERARQSALQSIQGQITDFITAEITVEGDGNVRRMSTGEAIPLREIEVVGDKDAFRHGRWTLWVLGRYPRTEYDRIRQQIAHSYALERRWRQAQSAFNQNLFEEADRLLEAVIREYDQGFRVPFSVSTVKLTRARTRIGLGDGVGALRLIEDVRQSPASTSDERAQAERLQFELPPIDPFFGKAVGVYACSKLDGHHAFDPELAQALNARLIAGGGTRTLAYPRLDGAPDWQMLDETALVRIAAAFASQGADVVFTVLREIDTTLTGRQVPIPGTDATMEALDVRLHYWVIRATDGLVLASGSTPGYQHRPIAALVNVIMTHRNHLPRHALRIAEQLSP